MRVAIQGERGSFHEVAASHYFRVDSYDVISCNTFDNTINSVKRMEADIAVIAIENARSGSILYNYSLLRESGLRVLGEQNLIISQNLMAMPGQGIDSIKEIWSHPVALSQCMNFLNGYPGISLVESYDTAASARRISEEKVMGVAAIGADLAATMYNLDILASGIETYNMNYTRFLVVGDDKSTINDANKASVCFSLGHNPGSLASLLIVLAEMNINLSKIQSVPKINREWEYMFYLDIEFDKGQDIGELINVIEKRTREMVVLGIYKKGENLYDSKNS